MSRVKLTILQPAIPEQVYSCHGCGNCCRDFTVQLRDEDLEKLREQNWDEKLGRSPVVAFRGEQYLRQRADGACVFLQDDGLCRIHAEFGFAAKPIACQLFPFHLTPAVRGVKMGINFACQSVLENKGAALGSHESELRRMARSLPEVAPASHPPMLTPSLAATSQEVQVIERAFDNWIRRDDVTLATRLDGLAFVVQSLAKAKLENVRGERLRDLLDVLFGALPQELELVPPDKPTPGHRRMARQAAFARVEDPKIGRVEQIGKARTVIGQLLRSRRFAAGKGTAPPIGAGWNDAIPLERAELFKSPDDELNRAAIDDLITRWLRASILGGRAWGAGYYGWSIVNGLQTLILNLIVVGWLARLHAAGESRDAVFTIDDVRAALSRVDRTAGRARWLGSRTELLRLRYFAAGDGLRSLINHYALESVG